MSTQADLSGTPQRASINVLLVDDQRFIGLALKRLLSPAPEMVLHQCIEASQAIVHGNAVRPDVILQDLVMDVDGLTVLSEFRRNALTATTPIIVLSGNDDAATRADAARAGANDYLVKLPASSVLIDCIRHHAATLPPGPGRPDCECATGETPAEPRR